MTELSAEWVSAITAIVAGAFTAGVYIRGRIENARRATPLIRCVWRTGTGGRSVKVEFVNRLDEDLLVTKVECKSRFVESEIRKTSAPDEPKFDYTFFDSPRELDIFVPAGSSSKLSLAIDGPETPRWLRFTLSSSAKTISRKRFVVRDNQMQ